MAGLVDRQEQDEGVGCGRAAPVRGAGAGALQSGAAGGCGLAEKDAAPRRRGRSDGAFLDLRAL